MAKSMVVPPATSIVLRHVVRALPLAHCALLHGILAEKIAVGGQAVIEGVMMRSPGFVATAVRRPDGEISVRKAPYVSLSKQYKILGLPILRGAVVLIETLSLGVSALAYSAEEALNEDDGKEDGKPNVNKNPREAITKLSLTLTVIVALVLGFALFFYLPLFVAEKLELQSGFWFNLVDGAVRLVIFLLYISLIGLWGEMQKLYQYHGAEHKSIHAFEAGEELTPDKAMKYTTLHPRCGTSFLLMVVVVSLVVFIALGKPETWAERGIRFLMVPLIAGVSFEITKLSGKYAKSALGAALITPGLWLQRLTTREPSREQVEVALRALREVL
jgi:uncharacterized protein YqhQ